LAFLAALIISFRRITPEFIQSFQVELIGTSKEQLLEILVNRVELLQKVIKDGLSDETSLLERLAIYHEM
jgi:hypothetical protein